MLSIYIISESQEDCRKIRDILKEYNQMTGSSFFRWELIMKREDVHRLIDADLLFFRIRSMRDYDELCQIRRKDPHTELILLTEGFHPVISRFIVPEIRPLYLMSGPLEENNLRECFRRVLRYVLREEEERSFTRRFFLREGTCRVFFRYSQISYFETRNKRVVLHTDDKEYEFYDSFARMEESLPADFIRCHRSYMVNVIYIASIDPEHFRIILTSGQEIPISKKYRSRVEDLFHKNI